MPAFRSCFIGAAFIACVVPRASADIVNGGFESPASPPDAGGFVAIGPGQEISVGFCGWTVESGSVDVVDAHAPLFGIDWGTQASVEGAQILDLNGYSNGTMSQVFATPPDMSHNLTFWYSNNPLSNNPETALVTITDAANGTVWFSETISHSNATLTDPHWVQFTRSFVAIGTRTRIRFTSTTPANGASDGIVLDAVSVTLASRAPLPGDMNCDGLVNALDLPPFVQALLDPAAYALAHPCCYLLNGDITGDGLVDGDDIGPFTNCQISGHCP